MIARIQQMTTLGILALAVLLLLLTWDLSAPLAVGLFSVTVLGYCAVLASQFLAMRMVNTNDPAPLPTVRQCVQAWLWESMTAAQVFCWWQPFRASQHPDRCTPRSYETANRGVVLVHGFMCNRAVWTRWLPVLTARAIPFMAVNLEPPFGSIDDYVGTLDKAVQQITLATGQPPLLVCHSMGGLVARAWLAADPANLSKVHHVVTIASPHHGTRVGTWIEHPSWLKNAVQMRHASPWLQRLAESESPASLGKFTCFYSNCDNIVTPASSARLNGADNRLSRGVPHVAMALHSGIMQQCLAMLK